MPKGGRVGRLMDIRGLCIAGVVLQALVFGLGSAITKLAYESISPWWCLTIRFGLAALAFGVLFAPRIVAGLRAVQVRDWLPAALCMAVSYISCNVALDLTSATNVGFLMALPVVFTPVIAAVVLRRRYRLVHLPFQAAVVGGLYLLCSSGGTFSFGPGEALALLCAVTGAGAYVFGERGMAHMDVTAMSFAQIAVTFVVSLAGTFAFDGPLDVAAVQPEAWGVVAFLALASTCLAFALQNAALVCLPSSTVSMLLASEPIFTALFSWGILGETLSLVGLAGAAVITVCVVGETLVDGRAPRPARRTLPVSGAVPLVLPFDRKVPSEN